ncbi:hypothetical protein GOBAR_DD35942 [Gossypium barbadense]|nr:hypothetical protein GOBAR_DD35942 [Gossypium barbadense]
MVGKYDGLNDDPARVVLAVLTASFGVTGYSLPQDQVGYWAVKIVTGVPDAIPKYAFICYIGIHNQMCLCFNHRGSVRSSRIRDLA